MAVNAYMKIDGIPGESTDEQHKDEIEVMSFSWGATQAGTAHPVGGAGVGKVQFQDFHFSSHVSKASPVLLKACATGEHIKEATITVRRASDNRGGVDFMFVKMSDVLISSFQQSGSGDVPSESLSMQFAKVDFEYKPQKADGSLGAAVRFSWDLKANKAV